MKEIWDMTEPELRELTIDALNAVKKVLPMGTCYAVLFWPFGETGIGQYGSNARRPEMIKALREIADRLEREEDVTR